MYKTGVGYSRRAIEVDIIQYVDDVLADPDASFSVALIVGSRMNGIRALLVQGVVARLRERGPAHWQPEQVRGEWSKTGAIQFCVSESDVPDTPPPAGAAVRLLLVACFDLDQLPSWMAADGGPHTRMLPVGPLSLLEAQEFIEARLGGPVDPSTARTVALLGGFVPNGLAVVIDECRSHGVLERMAGAWQLLGDPVQLAMVPYLRAQLAAASPVVARCLFLFALTEPFSLEGLSTEESDVATMLLRDGELLRRNDGRLEYTAVSAGEGLRAIAPADERARIYGDALRAGAASIHAIRWAASTGHPIQPELLDAVAEESSAAHDWQAVLDIADLAGDLSGDHVDADAATLSRLYLYAALAARFLPDPGRVHAHLDRAEDLLPMVHNPEATELVTRARVIRADLIHYCDGDPDTAVQTLSTDRADGADGADEVRLRGHILLHQIYGGRHREAREILETDPDPLRHAPSGLRNRIAVAETLMLTAAGSPERALRQAAQAAAKNRFSSPRGPVTERELWLKEEFRFASVTAALGSDGPEAFPLLEKQFNEPGSSAHRPDLVTFYFLMATWEFARGDIDRGRRLGSLALDAAESVDPSGLAAAVVALLAETSALRGDDARALALLARVANLPPRSSAVIAGWVQRHLASTRMLLNTPRASESLRETAATFTAQGQYGFAAEVLYAGIRFGRRRAARDLCAISENLEGHLHRLRVDQAAALLAEDPVALLSVADELQSVGLRLYSAEAAATAIGMLSTPESLRHRASNRVAAFLSEQPLPGHTLLRTATGPPGEAPLTTREREITHLIDSGLSNAEIAAHLTLSVSTVEGHITRIYRKVGGRRRAPGRR